ncbi:hypothetical protein [Halobacillus ihumii]|uniref:hypothetical protein n=1 Tax=Halobacillus ihumii TaxID=2686092 RepID=UPI0013D8D456|nr:hypothetical protein [Halobacillus ihumii]
MERTVEQLEMNFEDRLERRLDVGKSVKVIEPDESVQVVEDYAYLKKFQGLQGIVRKIEKSESGNVSFVVDFEKAGEGIFYETELKLLSR